MTDLCVLSNIGCEERKKRENVTMQQRMVIVVTTRNSRVCTASERKNDFSRSRSCKQCKKLLLNQDNHEKKQSR